MTDDEVMDYTYNKVFGDLDGIRSGQMFGKKESDTQGATPNAGEPGMAGISLEIKPLMAAAAESGRPDDLDGNNGEDEDKLKGIGRMSPLMSQLHGER
jgi:hypothetical protein